MNNSRTTIAISKQTFNQIHALKHKLETIVNKKLTPEKVIRILLCSKPLEDQLTDIMIEAEALSKISAQSRVKRRVSRHLWQRNYPSKKQKRRNQHEKENYKSSRKNRD